MHGLAEIWTLKQIFSFHLPSVDYFQFCWKSNHKVQSSSLMIGPYFLHPIYGHGKQCEETCTHVEELNTNPSMNSKQRLKSWSYEQVKNVSSTTRLFKFEVPEIVKAPCNQPFFELSTVSVINQFCLFSFACFCPPLNYLITIFPFLRFLFSHRPAQQSLNLV
jgi:hypothetical protein